MSFAPYQPPPDLPPDDAPEKKKKNSRPWFSRDQSSFAPSLSSGYQSGSTAGQTSYSSTNPVASSSQPIPGAYSSAGGEEAGLANSWETRFGFRVDVEAAFAYILGPISALLLLILETSNDFVRFHAYQSALLTTPLLLVHVLVSLLFWHWFKVLFIVFEFALILFMAWRAFTDGSKGLERFYLPIIGDYAEKWVAGE